MGKDDGIDNAIVSGGEGLLASGECEVVEVVKMKRKKGRGWRVFKSESESETPSSSCGTDSSTRDMWTGVSFSF